MPLCCRKTYIDEMCLHILLLSLVFTTGTLGVQYKDLKMLEDNLLSEYSANLRPVNESSDTVMVEVELSVAKIVGLDVSKEVLDTWLAFKVTWIDQRLHWEEEEYPGVRMMNVPRSKVWIPDLQVLKSAHKESKLEGNDYVQVSPDGKNQWCGQIETRTWCSMYVTKFPFDDQTCAISLSVIHHHEQEVNITSVVFSGDFGAKNPGWTIKSVRAHREIFQQENETRSGATLEFEFKRYSVYYLFSAFLPIVTVCCVNPFVFLVRAKSGEKISTSVTLFLSFTIFISLLSDMVPQTSSSTPFLFILIHIEFMMNAGIVIQCILRSRGNHRRNTKRKCCPKLFGWFAKNKKCQKVTPVNELDTEKDESPKENMLDEQLLEDKLNQKTFIAHFIVTAVVVLAALIFLLL